MQDRVDAQMRAGRRRGVELVPELRRLVAHVPSAFEAARREHALLRARRLFVAADAGDQSVETVFRERHLQAFGLARGRARGRRQGRIDGIDRRAGLDAQVEIPFLAVVIAERVHLRKFLAGVDMQRRERHAAEEGLARQPDHDVGVLAERPQQRELLQPRKSLAENVDALRLQRVEMVHRDAAVQNLAVKNLRHGRCLDERSARCGLGGFVGENRHLVDLGLERRKFHLRCAIEKK